MTGVRLRQAVLVAAPLDRAVRELRNVVGAGAPFEDPAAAEFGVENAVLALGDTFVEVIAPLSPSAPAARHLARGGVGYMLMFQCDDLPAARRRAAEEGVRTVWETRLHDMASVHLHPADMGGAIVSLERPLPPASWRWGGAGWQADGDRYAAGRLTGAVVAVEDPQVVARRWGRVLDADVREARLLLDGATVRFEPRRATAPAGLVELSAAVAPALVPVERTLDVCGLRLRMRAMTSDEEERRCRQ